MSQQDFWKEVIWPPDLISGETIATVPGVNALVVPIGTTAERPGAGSDGMIRFNTDTSEIEIFKGASWNIVSTVGGGVTLSVLEDGDADTQIFVENFSGADDDIIAFTLGDNAGTFTVPASVLNFSTAGFSVITPTGNAAQAGVAFSVTTGDGNVAAAGGAINLTTGDGGANGDGGALTLTSGDSGASAGDGGAIILDAGDSTVATGGAVSATAGASGTGIAGAGIGLTAGTSDNAAGGRVTLTGGDVVGGAGIGGGVDLVVGASLGAAGGTINLTSGDGDGASNAGGAIVLTGGQGDTTTGTGGAINLNGGAGGATSGPGGNINILSGAPAGGGAGGDIVLTAANALGVAVGGGITLTGGTGGDTSGVGGSVMVASGDGGTGDFGGALTLTSGDGDGSSDGGDITVTTGDGGAGGGSAGGDFNLATGTGVGSAGNINLTAGNSAGVAGDIVLTAGTGGTAGEIDMDTDGVVRLVVTNTGRLTVPTGYELLVDADEVLTNKKYVDDEIVAAVHPADINGTMHGSPAAGTTILHYPAVRPMTIAGAGHFSFCDPGTVASVSGATFDIFHVSPGGGAFGAPVGTITFAVGAATGVVTLGPIPLAPGDALVVVYAVADGGPTLGNVGFTFLTTAP